MTKFDDMEEEMEERKVDAQTARHFCGWWMHRHQDISVLIAIL